MDKNNIIFYGHGGSGNHGCEAIIRSLLKIITHYGIEDKELVSIKPNEDVSYKIDRIITIKDALSKQY